MSDERTVEPGIGLVTIKNTTRSSVTFRVPGRSVHLQPGQTADVPRLFLDTAELKILCRQGAVAALHLPVPRPSPTAHGPEQKKARREEETSADGKARRVEGSNER